MKSRLSRLSATLAAVVVLAAAGTASAQYRGDYGPEYDYAEVLSVDPRARRNAVATPIRSPETARIGLFRSISRGSRDPRSWT